MTPPIHAPLSYPGRNSPGYADLGVRHFGGSTERVNPAVSAYPDPMGGYPNRSYDHEGHSGVSGSVV